MIQGKVGIAFTLESKRGFTTQPSNMLPLSLFGQRHRKCQRDNHREQRVGTGGSSAFPRREHDRCVGTIIRTAIDVVASVLATAMSMLNIV